MNIDLTRQSLFANMLYITLLMILFGSGWFSMSDVEHLPIGAFGGSVGTPMGVYTDALFRDMPILGLVLSSLLVFINSLIVVKLCIRSVLFLERGYMPALVYVIVSAGYFSSYTSFRPLVASFLILSACRYIFKSYSVKSLATGIYLNVGVLFGMAASVYEPTVVMFPLVIIALILFRMFDLREWLAAIAGFVMPLFFLAYGRWLMGEDFMQYFEMFYETVMSPSVNIPDPRSVNFLEWSFIATVLIIVVLSIVKFIRAHSRGRMQAYRAYVYFIWIFVACVLMIIYLPCRSLNLLPLMAIPLAVIIPTYFNASKPSFLSNFLYLLFIGGAIMIRLVPMLRDL